MAIFGLKLIDCIWIPQDNVLPSMAEAVVNHRIHPMQTSKEVIDYNKYLINDPNVEIEIKGDVIEPHPISPYDSDAFGYQTIKKSISQVFTDTIAIPGVFVASTDTRYYLKFTKVSFCGGNGNLLMHY